MACQLVLDSLLTTAAIHRFSSHFGNAGSDWDAKPAAPRTSGRTKVPREWRESFRSTRTTRRSGQRRYQGSLPATAVRYAAASSNCSSSVEPSSAVTEVWPLEMVVMSLSKKPVPTNFWCFTAR